MILLPRNSSRRTSIVTLSAKRVRKRRLLERGVAAADDGDLAAAEEEAVAGGAGGDAATAELLLGWQAEPQRGRAGGDDDRVGAVLVLADPDPERPLAEVDRVASRLDACVGAEALGLLAELLHQLRPLDARPGSRGSSRRPR